MVKYINKFVRDDMEKDIKKILDAQPSYASPADNRAAITRKFRFKKNTTQVLQEIHEKNKKKKRS